MSKYYGVSEQRGKYRARITVHGKTFCLGTYNREQDAAIEYDNAVRRLRGLDAKKLNFPGMKVKDQEPAEKPVGTPLSLHEPIWVSGDGRQTPISLLANNHLLNIERTLRYKGARIPPGGSQEHWYFIINSELERRGLEPLAEHPHPLDEVIHTPEPLYKVGNDSQRKPLSPQGADENKVNRAKTVNKRIAKGEIKAHISEG